jgi:hypothetical protein
MKKITTLILIFTCFAMAGSFSQTILQIENGTNCTVLVQLYSYDLNTCTNNGFQSVTVPPGASIPVNSLNSNSEWVLAEIQNDPCKSSGNYGIGIEADGLNGCLPCPSFGYPSQLNYNYCPNCQPFKALWNTYCGSNNPHLHLYY